MRFFEKEDESLQYWKNKVLRILLIICFVFGVIAYIPSIILAIHEQLTNIIIIDTVALIILAALVFLPSKTYHFRASILMLIFYFLGIGLLIFLGPYGAGFVWLLSFPIISAILLNQKAAFLAIFMMMISLLILGILIVYGKLDHLMITQYSIQAWIINAINLLCLSLITVFPITMIVKNIEKKLVEEKQLNIQKETILKSLEESKNDLKKKNKLLNKSNQELDNFIYRVSHDLRAPLSSVFGLIQISKKEKSPSQKAHYLELISKSVVKLDRFIKELINFSRTTRLEIAREPVSFSSIIDSVMEDLKYMDNYKTIKIIKEIKENSRFRSDPYRCKIIFTNIISNAIKYSTSINREPHILIKIETNIHQADILFEDNGIGIKEDRLPKIFDMFYRANDTFEGSGLGLYITKEAVTRIGGTISVESETNNGTRFKLELPNLAKVKTSSISVKTESD